MGGRRYGDGLAEFLRHRMHGETTPPWEGEVRVLRGFELPLDDPTKW
ncbi:MAG: hypothetical protein Q8P18_09805 [Pseudomonadota bacterium]|nr:hypothetical protein [Pseudomonadota bacterium]